MLKEFVLTLPLLVAGKENPSTDLVTTNTTVDILDEATLPSFGSEALCVDGDGTPVTPEFKYRKVNGKNTPVIAPPTEWSKDQLSSAVELINYAANIDEATLKKTYEKAVSRASSQGDEARHLITLRNIHSVVTLGIYAGHSNEEIAGLVGLGLRQTVMGANIEKGEFGWLGLTEAQQAKLAQRIDSNFKRKLGDQFSASEDVRNVLILMELLTDARELFAIQMSREPNADEQLGDLLTHVGNAAYFAEQPDKFKELKSIHSSWKDKEETASRIRTKLRQGQASDRERQKLSALEPELIELKEKISLLINDAAEATASQVVNDSTRNAISERFLSGATPSIQDARKSFAVK